MTETQFRTICAVLLKTHFGLELDDTTLADDYAEGGVQGADVYHAINQLAHRFDLQRIDDLKNQPLTLKDQVATMRSSSITYIQSEQPTQCPVCGSRTDLIEVSNTVQLHDCLNRTCQLAFISTAN
ncbi:hypothetical protein [Chitinilyticum piscinae]|uniref:Uncharacterized protein n=1 Tax=Chitinilyticum piscinae TaxID=2866724 RepID=A0A8J7K7B7_9NEIS|nr:hypothetical protein [Chitinilyticum piscinae]MBE9607798.1 hypothetical protein [Chitinilyticum piscinae]